MGSLKNLEKAIQKQPKQKNNFFDKNYSLEDLLRIEVVVTGSTEHCAGEKFISDLQQLATSISKQLLNFEHYSKLMDAEETEQNNFYKKFKYLKNNKTIDLLSDDQIQKHFAKALVNEYNKINDSLFDDPSFKLHLKNLQISIIEQTNKVIDLITLFREVRESKVLMQFFGIVVSRSHY